MRNSSGVDCCCTASPLPTNDTARICPSGVIALAATTCEAVSAVTGSGADASIQSCFGLTMSNTISPGWVMRPGTAADIEITPSVEAISDSRTLSIGSSASRSRRNPARRCSDW